MDKNEYKRLRLTLEAAFGQKKEVLTAYKKATSVAYEGVKEDEFKKELDKYADEFLKSIDEIIFGKKILKGMRKVDATSIKKSVDDLTDKIEKLKEKYLVEIKEKLNESDSLSEEIEGLSAEVELKLSERKSIYRRFGERIRKYHEIQSKIDATKFKISIIEKELKYGVNTEDKRAKKSYEHLKKLHKSLKKELDDLTKKSSKYGSILEPEAKLATLKGEIKTINKQIKDKEDMITKHENDLPKLKEEVKGAIEKDEEISKLKKKRHKLIAYLKNTDRFFDSKGRDAKKASVLAVVKKCRDKFNKDFQVLYNKNTKTLKIIDKGGKKDLSEKGKLSKELKYNLICAPVDVVRNDKEEEDIRKKLKI